MTTSERVVVKELSSSLLDMKFMLKKKKRIETKEARKREIKLEKSIAEKESQPACSKEPRANQDDICYNLAKLENLMFGRLSFNGFNKDVENLMEYYERRRRGEISDDEEDDGKDVDDQEMAHSFGAQKLAAISKKSQSKRERRQQNEKNEEGTGNNRKFNFKDVRKRGNDGRMDEMGAPERKFMKPQEDDF
uniref:M-phase phosphoprotein 6 n=1 Tax=Caenorhabditis tropicalis TaxID=1561998 RepID=A0A1I7U411_9PELO